MKTIGTAALGIAGAGLISGQLNAESGNAVPVIDPGKPIRIGVIGRVGHSYMVYEAMKELDNAMITAYAFEDGDWDFNCDGTRRGVGYGYDLDSQVSWLRGADWGKGAKPYETYQEMLDKEKLDVVAVFLPYVRIPYAAAVAAERGLHVMAEKPVAITYADLEMLEKAVYKNKVRLSALLSYRSSGGMRAVQKAIADGLIGRVCQVRGQKSYKFGEERPWFYKNSAIYGSTTLWIGIHAIDYMRFTTGLDVETVYSIQGNLSRPDYPGCQTSAAVLMQMEGGVQGIAHADYLRPAEEETHGDDGLRIMGTEGKIETRDNGQRFEITAGGEKMRVLEPLPDENLFTNFVNSLRGRCEHFLPAGEAERSTYISLRATESAETGKVLIV